MNVLRVFSRCGVNACVQVPYILYTETVSPDLYRANHHLDSHLNPDR